MINEIGSYDAKTKLPEILRRVEAGETFTITHRGKPVADLLPSKAAAMQKAQEAINNILQSKKQAISDRELTDLRENRRK